MKNTVLCACGSRLQPAPAKKAVNPLLSCVPQDSGLHAMQTTNGPIKACLTIWIVFQDFIHVDFIEDHQVAVRRCSDGGRAWQAVDQANLPK